MGSRADAANPMTKIDAIIAERDAEIARLRAELAKWIELHKLNVALPERSEDDAEIERLQAALSTWEQTGNAIMQCAVGREAPLSDSDVCGEINALRAQVAELQAWKGAVPVKALRYIVYDCDIRYAEGADDVIRKWLKEE